MDDVVREVERLERGEPREHVGMDDVQVVHAQVRVLELVQRCVLLRALGTILNDICTLFESILIGLPRSNHDLFTRSICRYPFV